MLISFVLTALNLSILKAGILIMVHQIRLMMFLLKMVDYSLSFISLSICIFFDRQVGGPFRNFLTFRFFCGTPPSCLKVMGWVAHRILVSPLC